MLVKNALAVLKKNVRVSYESHMGSRSAIFSLDGRNVQVRNVGNGCGYSLKGLDESLYEWLDLKVEGVEFIRNLDTFAIDRETYERNLAVDPDFYLKGWI